MLRLLLLLSFLISSLHAQEQIAQEQILISVAPYTEIIQELAGDAVKIELIVPQGADSHNYEPTPKQVEHFAHSKAWFCIGEPFENKIKASLKNLNPDLLIVDLRQHVTLYKEDACCHIGGVDPHIWMSPKLMMIQAKTIASTLQTIFPDKVELLASNLQKILKRLQELDTQFRKLFENTHITIITAHAAYGYFCREYGISELSIESAGKEPTIKQLQKLIDEARKLAIKKVFVQNQYSHKGAEIIAQEINAKIVMLNPFSTAYFAMLQNTANEFKTSQ